MLFMGFMREYHADMRPVYTLEEAKETDHRLVAEDKLDETALIDSAAAGAYNLTKDFLKGRICVAVGPGNNGSDGLEYAYLLFRDGFDVSVFYLADKGNAENIRRRKMLEGKVPAVSSLSGFDTVIDALFGFSLDPSRTEYRNALDEIGDALLIALDVPSGFYKDTDITVTFMVPKAEMYLPSLRGKCGRIFCFNPGFPEDKLTGKGMYLLSDEDSEIHRISIADYKNTRGHVLAIGGSQRYPGALRLLCRSCFAAGAGLVTVFTDEKTIFREYPSLMPFSDSSFSRFSSIAIGPGWGDGDPDILSSAASSGRPLVVDADAVKYAHRFKYSWNAVLTPHVGEYRTLMRNLDLPDGLESAASLRKSLLLASRKLEAVIVMKSASLWIADGDDVYIYDGADPSIGVAGAGDVLTGIIAALLGQGEKPLQAAADGVILHQKAGRSAHGKYGYYPAEELIAETGRLR